MREEVLLWLKQAEEDFVTARVNNDNARYYACAFFCQQTAEKSLKALVLLEKKAGGPTHNLIGLAKLLDAPVAVVDACRRLNPDYVIPRYPDAANGLPADAYDSGLSLQKLADAEKVLQWVLSRTKI